jgi:hypothetical protein
MYRRRAWPVKSARISRTLAPEPVYPCFHCLLVPSLPPQPKTLKTQATKSAVPLAPGELSFVTTSNLSAALSHAKHEIADDEADAESIALQIRAGLDQGIFRLN